MCFRGNRVKIGSIGLYFSVLLCIFGCTNYLNVDDQSSGIKGKVIVMKYGVQQKVSVQLTLEGTSYETWTNNEGEYVLNKAPVGTYTVLARKYGYGTVSKKNIAIKTNEMTELETITLYPEGDIAIPTIKSLTLWPYENEASIAINISSTQDIQGYRVYVSKEKDTLFNHKPFILEEFVSDIASFNIYNHTNIGALHLEDQEEGYLFLSVINSLGQEGRKSDPIKFTYHSWLKKSSMTEPITGLTKARGITVGHDNQLYLGQDTLMSVYNNSFVAGITDSISDASSPYAIARDENTVSITNTKVYAINNANKAVCWEAGVTNRKEIDLTANGLNIQESGGLAVLNGRLYITGKTTNTILIIDDNRFDNPADTFLQLVSGLELESPAGVGISQSGIVYVANKGRTQLVRFNPNNVSSTKEVWDLSKLSINSCHLHFRPHDVHVSDDGWVYVTMENLHDRHDHLYDSRTYFSRAGCVLRFKETLFGKHYSLEYYTMNNHSLAANDYIARDKDNNKLYISLPDRVREYETVLPGTSQTVNNN